MLTIINEQNEFTLSNAILNDILVKGLQLSINTEFVSFYKTENNTKILQFFLSRKMLSN